MTALPSVEPLPPGTVPTEPGWYLREQPNGAQDFVEIVSSDDGLAVLQIGDEMWKRLADAVAKGSVFLARIYPDQMEQE